MMELHSYVRNLCDKGGNTEVEFKSALGGFPNSFWETYSAFGNVELTLYLGSAENHQETTQKTTQKTTTKDKILNLVRANPKITTDEMAEIIGITRDGINYHLKKMRGVSLERRDGDNGGHWEIIKK